VTFTGTVSPLVFYQLRTEFRLSFIGIHSFVGVSAIGFGQGHVRLVGDGGRGGVEKFPLTIAILILHPVMSAVVMIILHIPPDHAGVNPFGLELSHGQFSHIAAVSALGRLGFGIGFLKIGI